jgi:hypothetical protein
MPSEGPNRETARTKRGPVSRAPVSIYFFALARPLLFAFFGAARRVALFFGAARRVAFFFGADFALARGRAFAFVLRAGAFAFAFAFAFDFAFAFGFARAFATFFTAFLTAVATFDAAFFTAAPALATVAAAAEGIDLES